MQVATRAECLLKLATHEMSRRTRKPGFQNVGPLNLWGPVWQNSLSTSKSGPDNISIMTLSAADFPGVGNLRKAHHIMVVQESCMDDDERRWGRAKFNPLPPSKPSNDPHPVEICCKAILPFWFLLV